MVSTGPYSEILKERKKEEISPKKAKILKQWLHHGSQISALCYGQK